MQTKKQTVEVVINYNEKQHCDLLLSCDLFSTF